MLYVGVNLHKNYTPGGGSKVAYKLYPFVFFMWGKFA